MTWDESVLARLRSAKRWAVLTGAGISAESGVPTFRDAQTGLWANFRAEDLATPEAFLRNPGMVWEWYAMRRDRIALVRPNAGHYALADIESRVEAFTLITQNIDDLHRKAGSRRVLELHGNILRTKCFAENTVVDRWDSVDVPPKCPRCGAMLRPDVVWFGEMLPADEMREAMEAARNCDVFLSIGTSGLVYPAAGLPFEARQRGAVLVEINPEETPLSPYAHLILNGKSGEVLPTLVECLNSGGK